MDSSDEKSCEGVTHVCDPNVKFGCKDSGERGQSGTSWVGGGHLENVTVLGVVWSRGQERARVCMRDPGNPNSRPELSTSTFCRFLPSSSAVWI